MRLINADALIDSFCKNPSYSAVMFSKIKGRINAAPTIEAATVKHGRWDEIPNRYMSISSKDGSYSGHATSCSVCHEVNPNAFKTNYCPNCGAKMDGGADA